MKPLIAFGILVIVAFLGAIKLFNRFQVSSPFSYLFYSGTAFIFFGLIIGQNGLNLISHEIIHQMEPLLNFSLGWVGFLFGFQLEFKYLKRIHWSWYTSMFSTYFFTFFSIFLLSFWGLSIIKDAISMHFTITIGISLVLAILLSESSVTFIVWSTKFFKKQTNQLRQCSFIASSDNFFPIVFTGFIFSLYNYFPEAQEILTISTSEFFLSFSLQLIIGLFGGMAIHFLSKSIVQKWEISAVFFGVIFFISGLAKLVHYSPLFVSMIAGVVFSNITRRHTFFINILNPTEKPIYIFFLIYLSMQQAELTLGLVLLVIILVVTKFLSKGLIFIGLSKINPTLFDVSPYFSYLLLPLGSIAPAILLDLFNAFHENNIQKLIGVFLLIHIILEIFAPAAIRITQNRLKFKK